MIDIIILDTLVHILIVVVVIQRYMCILNDFSDYMIRKRDLREYIRRMEDDN